MGSTFDITLASEFALKTSTDKAPELDSELRQRFIQEGKALSQLTSEHVVDVYATGESNGTLYMVLELIRGLSLKQHLAHEGTLKLINAARVVTQILSALEHAHAAGLIHRDLKPSNILFTDLNATHLKLIDFGIAKSLNPSPNNGPVTQTGLVIGTVQYMAPEQLRQNLPIGPASDLYATGILFYQFLSGDTPFKGSQAEIAAGHLYQSPPELEASLAIPPAVTDWLQTALSKEPADRFPNAMTMRIELAKAMGTPEENLNTTLPLANDTIRMTPDISFMQGISRKDTSSDEEQFVEPSSTGVLGSRTSSEISPKSMKSISDRDKELSLSALVRGHHKGNESSVTNEGQASTQKLTPVQLMKASERAKRSSAKVSRARPVETSEDKPQTDLNNRTALADIPLMLFENEMDKQDRSINQASPAHKDEAKAIPQTEAEQLNPTALPSIGALDAISSAQTPTRAEPIQHEHSTNTNPRQPFSTSSKSGTESTNAFGLPTASVWWVLPFIMVLSVILSFIWF